MIYNKHFDKNKDFLIFHYDMKELNIEQVEKLLFQSDLLFGAWYNVVCVPEGTNLDEVSKEKYAQWLKEELESLEG